jgi:integrase
MTAPKTKASTRDIYLPAHMMDDLQEYLNWYKDNNVYKSNYVLFGTFFKAFSESAIDRWFTGTLKALDETLLDGEAFPRIVIHELRHSHASMLVNHGASPMIIAQ